jgi:hypothetical protein
MMRHTIMRQVMPITPIGIPMDAPSNRPTGDTTVEMLNQEHKSR